MSPSTDVCSSDLPSTRGCLGDSAGGEVAATRRRCVRQSPRSTGAKLQDAVAVQDMVTIYFASFRFFSSFFLVNRSLSLHLAHLPPPSAGSGQSKQTPV